MKRWWPLVALAIAQFVMVLDQSVMNVSISTLVQDFDTSVTTIQAVITLYCLVMAMFMLTGAKVGDILVFHPPAGAESAGANQCGEQPKPGSACDKPTPTKASVNFIKRVVGEPGDTIAVRDGRVIRNGKPTKEPFIADTCRNDAGAGCNFRNPITIPPGHWFMMGDNRGESDDSRFWGPIPKSWIIGNAFATYWPPSRIGIL